MEGCSIRSTERITGVHRDTIMRLIVRVGNACQEILDETMRGLDCRHVEVDEIWCYVGKKQRHLQPGDDPTRVGDFWTWVALDSESKLIPSFLVGKRTAECAHAFIDDLASRLTNRIHLSSDGLEAYVEATEEAFGADIDYAQIAKTDEVEPIGPGRYSPPKVVSTQKTVIQGQADRSRICTSYVERQNPTMRMSMRRFTRLTNAFSKKIENLKAAVALHMAWYNLVRIHKSLRCTPAMAAGVEKRLWSIEDLVAAP